MNAQPALYCDVCEDLPRPDERVPADRATCLRRATMRLAEEFPEMSATCVVTRRQAVVLSAFAAVLAAAIVAWPWPVADVAVAAMSIGFLGSLILRCVLALFGWRREAATGPIGTIDLPDYTVLVPVYREAGMIPQMARSLRGLDYPAAKLDICMVLEEDDRDTRVAVEAAGLRAIVVPPGAPRTKPKACNYALHFARGEFIVVYDAEDRPEPDQLRKAVAAFRANPHISCFQARLMIDRAPVWVARMFAIDYALWFRTLLPGLERLGAPIPLGGTSNHFRIAALVEAGAWDPFNVTEDADLGLRLARLGHRVGILDSTTYEEAPVRVGQWVRQRTRWMKGYMQTLLVHTRDPWALVRTVGLRGCLAILAFLGGAVCSALVNPLMWVICLYAILFSAGDHGTLELLARISGMTLLAANGLLAGMALIDGSRQRGAAEAGIVLSYPLYWLLISAATYRALWQLLRDPYRWEKTPHGAALQ